MGFVIQVANFITKQALGDLPVIEKSDTTDANKTNESETHTGFCVYTKSQLEGKMTEMFIF